VARPNLSNHNGRFPLAERMLGDPMVGSKTKRAAPFQVRPAFRRKRGDVD
jgi:hypothetical protein